VACGEGHLRHLLENTLLGTNHDDVIAEKIGRTNSAVASRRVRRKLPAFSGWTCGGPSWTAEKLALLGTDHDKAIAARVGRTAGAVGQKRRALRIEMFRDRRSR
jgi:hypothetical protein